MGITVRLYTVSLRSRPSEIHPKRPANSTDTVLSIGPTEQVARRLPPEQGPPPSPLMLRPVVVHVTALAERCEVSVPIVSGVVVAMGRCEYDSRSADRRQHVD